MIMKPEKKKVIRRRKMDVGDATSDFGCDRIESCLLKVGHEELMIKKDFSFFGIWHTR